MTKKPSESAPTLQAYFVQQPSELRRIQVPLKPHTHPPALTQSANRRESISEPHRATCASATVTASSGALNEAMRYFPMQNLPKISPSSASGVTRPTMDPSASCASRSSSASRSAGNRPSAAAFK